MAIDNTNEKQYIEEEIARIEQKMSEVNFWDNKQEAQEAVQKLKELKIKLNGEKALYAGDAVMSIIAGAGGDDSEDWARMLYDMYQRYLGKRGWGYTLLHTHRNEHDGIKNIVFEINGKGVYGDLRNESGVHRLVRVSPFNANAKRHTSFALVEVVPVLPETEKVQIALTDLDITFQKAGGPGGQNVNKRETSVRIVHKPTGLSVHIATERSQEQNREKALQLLQAKLYRLQQEKQKQEKEGLSATRETDIEWGNQIRNYVLHPYKLVKDVRTDIETSDVEGILNGELDDFITAEKDLAI